METLHAHAINEKLNFEESVCYLNENIQSDKSFAAGKLGISETRFLYQYLIDKKWSEKSIFQFYYGMGIFPETDNARIEFINKLTDSVSFMDALPNWSLQEHRNFELEFINNNSPKCKIIEVRSLEPYYSDNPWSQHLEGKKVLIISPFTNSIVKQYQNRNLLWQDQRILPDFELKLLKHQLSPALGIPSMYDSWIEMLADLKRKIELIDFDIALIGTGGSSLPLAIHCKKLGKKAIHLGGSLQVLFGIKGTRWDDKPHVNCFYNEHWIRPNEDEVPKDFKKLENGCYW
jgi:hypothetical protein